jgi:nucleoside-diphosphate-sugar epimerase
MTLDEASIYLANRRVALTGAGGFVGGHLLRRLLDLACAVRVLQRKPIAVQNAHVELCQGDIADASSSIAAFRGVDTVFHLAGTTRGTREDFWRSNVTGTRNVIDACLAAGVRRLVYVSSMGILQHARPDDAAPVSETAPLEPWPEKRGAYTHSKLEAEALVSAAIRERGLRAVIVRPGQIFGKGAERVAPNGVIALRGWNLVGQGNLPLPLVYVEDLVDALLLAAASEAAEGGTFNVVDAERVTQSEYLARWREQVHDVPLRRVPAWFVRMAATAAEGVAGVLGRTPTLSRYRVRSLRPLSPIDGSAAREVLGWAPRVGARRGLALTFGSAEGRS